MTMNLRLVRCEAGDDSQKPAFDNGFKYTVDRLYEERDLEPSSKNQVARDAEQRFELGDCLYFYAGYACPRFGDIVFVFEPSITSGSEGNAGDFDSGGHFLNYIKFARPPADSVAWARTHRWALGDWQQRCRGHVVQYWGGSWASFVRGERATVDDAEGRLHHEQNRREAWSVEVRIHDAQPIDEGILRIGVTSTAERRIRQLLRSDPNLARRARWLARLQTKVLVGYDSAMHTSIQEDIAMGQL